MRTIGRLFLMLMTLAGPASAGAPAQAAREPDGSAAALLQRIEAEGAEAVLFEIYEDDRQWQPVLRGIASGSSAWLRVGVLLKRAARAQAEELTVALARALEKAPAGVLGVFGDAFDADDVCSLNTLEQSLGNDYAAALRTVERRERAVSRVSDPRLLQHRDECLAFLRELKREVVRNKTTWFGASR